MKPKLDPAATIKAYKKLVKDLQAQVIILQAERDAAADLCQRQLEKIQRLEGATRLTWQNNTPEPSRK